jgi:uncharacterized protein
MSSRQFEPRHLDVRRFAADGAELSGAWPLLELKRLSESAAAERPPSTGDVVSWQARGEQGPGVEPAIWLYLNARTALALQCQRCLTPLDVDVAVNRRFRFVVGEATAAELDAESEDDVLALTRALDLQELTEDELLLALPLVPMHAVCPEPLPKANTDGDGEAVSNPFAVRASMRGEKTPDS